MSSHMKGLRWATAAFFFLTAGAAAACGGITELDVDMPPPQEFGFGPRTSAEGHYVARVEPRETIRINRLHSWHLELRDREGNGVVGATIEVDGGMPQHGHGLPTRPRVTKELNDGRYEVDGMRFNMGGWWVVTFRITGPAGTDTVTFNLAL